MSSVWSVIGSLQLFNLFLGAVIKACYPLIGLTDPENSQMFIFYVFYWFLLLIDFFSVEVQVYAELVSFPFFQPEKTAESFSRLHHFKPVADDITYLVILY